MHTEAETVRIVEGVIAVIMAIVEESERERASGRVTKAHELVEQAHTTLNRYVPEVKSRVRARLLIAGIRLNDLRIGTRRP